MPIKERNKWFDITNEQEDYVMNIRKLKKYWHKVLPNTKKIPKSLLHFCIQDKKLAQKYLEGKITLGEYLYQREKYQLNK